MAEIIVTELKRRRGTAQEHAVFTGAEGEITVDITSNRAVVHDGATAGGHPAARLDEVQAAQSTAGAAQSAAEAAQSTAETAQSAAETAQSAAETAQSAAEAAQSTAETAQSEALWVDHLSSLLAYSDEFKGTDLLVSALQFTPGKRYLFAGSDPNVPIADAVNCFARVIVKDGKGIWLEAIAVDGAETYRNLYVDNAWRGWRRCDSGAAFPSAVNIAMSLPPSGGSVTPPLDGYLWFWGASTGTGAYVALGADSSILIRWTEHVAGTAIRGFIPVAKGVPVNVNYNGVTVNSFTLTASKGGAAQ